MNKEFDEFAEELQKQIFEEAKKAYGEKGFNRWLEMKYMGVIEEPDGHAHVRGKCGDSIDIFLRFDGEKVEDAKFLTDGCASSAICGSFAAELAIGKTSDEIIEITGERIIEEIGGLPEEERHCAFLAAETLQEALNDYMTKQAKERKGEKR
ncbi:MAG: iron-sulfur cluster assembly scaffold protein [Deltaproteobacteria bacterium]|nr:MAG: iron-sulfur cluster assembly scaffold protein [Deltaproteobacteria bacterium]